LREEDYVRLINEHDENSVKYKRMLDELQRENKMMQVANDEDLEDMTAKQKKHIEGLTRKFNETLKEKEDDLVELENKVHEQHKDIEALTEEISRQR
jgi:iron-sulfur cluster repair protein YtfE (RIC family)